MRSNLFFLQNKLHMTGSKTATSVHPRWNENPYTYGIDYWGLFNHPAGWRDVDGEFYEAGTKALLYASTYNTSYSKHALELSLGNNEVDFVEPLNKVGMSIKVCRYVTALESTYFNGTIITNAYQDGSGNWYDGVKIWNRIWTVGYLRTTKLQNGTDIQKLTQGVDWAAATALAYCVYPFNLLGLGSEAEVMAAYGLLYNCLPTNAGQLVGAYGEPWFIASLSNYADLVSIKDPNDYRGAGILLKGSRQINHPLA